VGQWWWHWQQRTGENPWKLTKNNQSDNQPVIRVTRLSQYNTICQKHCGLACNVPASSLHCDALPHPVLACLLLLHHCHSCLIVIFKSVLIHCPTALLPMPLYHLLVLLHCLYCYCPQLIVVSFPLSLVYYQDHCHHSLCGSSCCCTTAPQCCFHFAEHGSKTAVAKTTAPASFLAKPLHHNAVAKAAALPHCCQSHRHAIAKAATLPCCYQSCFTTMVWYK